MDVARGTPWPWHPGTLREPHVAVPYLPQEPFIANTDRAWFDFLGSRAVGQRVDEVNFWLPNADKPMKHMQPGEPVFFRLKAPYRAIAGYGFYAHFELLDLNTAWNVFGWKNGDPDKLNFLQRIGGYRKERTQELALSAKRLGCTILRDAVFWPQSKWIPWGTTQGWADNIVQGKTERDRARAAQLIDTIRNDAFNVPADFDERFIPLQVDERRLVLRDQVDREGQGAFRLRLIQAYRGQCAITGEHTQPVLDAAHIQPYLGPSSNHIQNGLLLTKEFHALFDNGYVGITPDYEVRVSDRLRTDWNNGHRYYPFDRTKLQQLPKADALRPSPEALEWHMENVFLRAG